MAEIGEDLRTYLLADSAISALVGVRIHADVLPQAGSLPSIVISIIDSRPSQTLSGTPSSFATARIQFDCYGETRSSANAVAEKVRLRIQNKRATMGNTRVSGCVLLDGPRYGYDPRAEGTDQVRPITSLDFDVSHQTATS